MKVNPDFCSENSIWWLSNRQMTIRVQTNAAGNIQIAAPIVRCFIGQPLNNLIRWMENMGTLTKSKL